MLRQAPPPAWGSAQPSESAGTLPADWAANPGLHVMVGGAPACARLARPRPPAPDQPRLLHRLQDLSDNSLTGTIPELAGAYSLYSARCAPLGTLDSGRS